MGTTLQKDLFNIRFSFLERKEPPVGIAMDSGAKFMLGISFSCYERHLNEI